MGLKIMAPIELTRFIEREDRDFYQRARLDKQNMVPLVRVDGRSAVRRGQRPAASVCLPLTANPCLP
jgi:hypothetical protein